MADDTHPTEALIHLDRLTHNVRLLGEIAGGRPLWPAIKADAYGHGAEIVARHLVGIGIDTLCVAHISEAAALRRAGIEAAILTLSASLPSQAEAVVAAGVEPAVCTAETVSALAAEAARQGREVAVHLKVDTGMGRIGIRPDEVPGFLDHAQGLPGLTVKGVMSHFASADEADKSYSEAQTKRFLAVAEAARARGVALCHLANSAGIFDLPASHLDAVRPGIAIYGLAPSTEIANPRVAELRPVLDWTSRITFLKEVPAGVGLSYGHTFRTTRPSLIATVPVGYGDGLHRGLSNRCAFLVGGTRCPQVGRITMDQTLIDVTGRRGQVALGDAVAIIGRQGAETATADTLAATLDTINYEIVTAIAPRVPRRAAGGDGIDAPPSVSDRP